MDVIIESCRRDEEMPKSPTIMLKEELRKRSYELLDIYRFKDRDLIRLRNLLSGKVHLIESEKHVSDITSYSDLIEFINKLLSKIKK